MHTWMLGLKTGMYQLRSKSATNAIKFTVDQTEVDKSKNDREKKLETVGAYDVCIGCGA